MFQKAASPFQEAFYVFTKKGNGNDCMLMNPSKIVMGLKNYLL